MTTKPLDSGIEDDPGHPDTPRCGFDRNASHNVGYYVCMCGWHEPASAAPEGMSVPRYAERNVELIRAYLLRRDGDCPIDEDSVAIVHEVCDAAIRAISFAAQSEPNAAPQENKAGAASTGADFKAPDSDSVACTSRSLPNNPDGAALTERMEYPKVYAFGGILRGIGDMVLKSAYDALRSQNALLREDAERYRWLRKHFRFASDSMAEIWFDNSIDVSEPEELDAAIDAATGEK